MRRSLWLSEPSRSARPAADADLTAYGLTNLGALKIASGATSDGLALMEEASIAAVNGDLSPFTSGVTACRMIGACRDLTDYRRASEWIEATEKYCDRQSVSGFPGICRVHRAEVSVIGGAWDQAEQDLERATVELGAYKATPPQADGYYAIGDIRRLKGDFAGAEVALREAHARGRSPQPALALVRLAEGKVKAAAAAINAALDEETWDRWARARLLPAQVEISIAAATSRGPGPRSTSSAASSRDIPRQRSRPGRRLALGRVLVAEGDAPAATRELRAAIKGWREVGAPYEVARARAVLSRALRAAGNEDEAELELQAALDEFRRLGARVDVEAAERDLRDAEDRRSGPLSTRKTFMFTDIVGSTNLAEALGDQAWERLLRWHDDMLRRLVASGGGEIVNSTGDGFFVAFDSARVGDRLREIDPAGPGGPPGQHGLRLVRSDRPPHGRGEPARRRLQRDGGPRGRPGRGPRRWRGDPRDRRDPRRSARRLDLGCASGLGEGRDRAGERRWQITWTSAGSRPGTSGALGRGPMGHRHGPRSRPPRCAADGWQPRGGS